MSRTSPPVTITMSARAQASRSASSIAEPSGTQVERSTRRPSSTMRRPSHAALVLTTSPMSNSVPVLMSSTFINQSAADDAAFFAARLRVTFFAAGGGFGSQSTRGASLQSSSSA